PRLAAYLKTQPIERAYMLGDLDPAYAEQCQWFALPDASGAGIDAVILLYEGLRVPAVLTSGSAEDVQALLHAAADHLPRSFHTQIREHHRTALEGLYTLNEPATMHRMGVTRHGYRPSGTAEGVEVMGHRDTAAIMALYQHYPDNFFDPAQLSTGLYSGIREGGELVSLAGVHVYSRTWDVAAIGNIVTHTDHRGKGLASRCVRHLLDRLLVKVSHVALNVEAGNASAIACYDKFGFTKRYEYFEGIASR
ncbi:MAG: GNAT family N-acetyltransferase, partial [Myxococcales bacterium]|nr:GNAT family N-acetyltransferase [Myxococcales bacterium]